MTPLNHLLNYSAELAESSSFIANVSSRFVVAVAVPFEITAALENTIKLPFQAASVLVKFHAKVLNLFVESLTLKEFESNLAGPLDVLFTALKVVGYAIGVLATASLGLFYPYENFCLHYNLNLVRDNQKERQLQLNLENRQKKIAAYEKQIEERLKLIVDAMRAQSQLITPLTPTEREEIEQLTKVPCPPIDPIIESVEQEIPMQPIKPIEGNLPVKQIEILSTGEPETPYTQNEVSPPKEEKKEDVLPPPSNTDEKSPEEDLTAPHEQHIPQPLSEPEGEEETQAIDNKNIKFDECNELVNTKLL